MKKSFYLMAAFLVAMVGCNKEPQAGPGQDDASGDAVYMSFKVSTLETKSSTEDDGTSDANPDKEVGFANENKIQMIDLILVELDAQGAETANVVRADNVTASESQTDVYVASFNKNENSVELQEGNYNVYIYANADANETVNLVTDYTEVGADLKVAGGIAESDKFFMTSASVKSATVSDLAAHTTPSTPLDLGTFDVQRAAARFDVATAEANTVFEIADGVTLTITDVALINRAKNFYDFKRVAAVVDATPVLLGLETSNNWVVDYNWGAANTYHYPMAVNDEDTYPWVAVTALETADNWTDVDTEPTPAEEYYVLDYAAENTLKGIDAQKKGVTTGVVFRAKIEGALVTAAAGQPIYAFGNVLYGTWDTMAATAFAEGSTLYALQAAINSVSTKGTDGKYTLNADVDAADLAAAGFTGYSAAADGSYFTTYYYWNRHNDNGNNDTMSIMEFAVVRNNVYKLAVTDIKKYGHPYNPDPDNPNPDPDPENPTDPDESVNYYFTVSVKVLPWVVRVNNIEF